jgi:hypothetical protein
MSSTPDETWVARAVYVYDTPTKEWVPRPVRYHDSNRMAWVAGNLHLTGESAVTFPTLTAIPSSSVRSAFGVNVHLAWQWGPYSSNTATQDATIQAITDLGVGYFRDVFMTGGDTQQNRMIPILTGAGVKYYAGFFNYAYDTQYTVDAVTDLFNRYPDPTVFEALSGVNEPDDPGVDWHTHTVDIQRALYQGVRANHAWDAVPIVSPVVRSTLLTEIPEGAPYWDLTSIHHYPVAGKAFINAATLSQDLDYKLATYNSAFPGKGTSVDEYGTVTSNSYYPSTSSSSVPEAVTAVYHPRGVCEAVRRGIRVCMYELLDQADKVTEFGAHFGLVDTTAANGVTDPSVWRRKPSFSSLARLISLTRDDGPPFTPTPLQAVMTGSTAPKTLVLSKRTGEHGVLHWRDDLIYDGTAKTTLTVQPVAQTVTFPSPRSVTLTDVVTGTTTTLGAVTSYTVNVAGNVMHARIGSTGTTPTAPVNTIGFDTDGTPYFDPAGTPTIGVVRTDTDGTPYIDTTGTSTTTVAADTDGTPYVQ